MKKIFSLKSEDVEQSRHIEKVRQEINKYIARERKKRLPAGFDVWDFECKFGDEPADAQPIELNDISTKISEQAAANKLAFYLEVVAKPAKKKKKSPFDS